MVTDCTQARATVQRNASSAASRSAGWARRRPARKDGPSRCTVAGSTVVHQSIILNGPPSTSMLSSRHTASVILTVAVLLFTLLGFVLIPLAGIQDDEALFTVPLFAGGYPHFSLSIFGHHPPLMVFAYTGALKTYFF